MRSHHLLVSQSLEEQSYQVKKSENRIFPILFVFDKIGPIRMVSQKFGFDTRISPHGIRENKERILTAPSDMWVCRRDLRTNTVQPAHTFGCLGGGIGTIREIVHQVQEGRDFRCARVTDFDLSLVGRKSVSTTVVLVVVLVVVANEPLATTKSTTREQIIQLPTNQILPPNQPKRPLLLFSTHNKPKKRLRSLFLVKKGIQSSLFSLTALDCSS